MNASDLKSNSVKFPPPSTMEVNDGDASSSSPHEANQDSQEKVSLPSFPHMKEAHESMQQATRKALHKLEGGFTKIGLGLEKAAKTVTKTAATVIDPRNEGLKRTKSQASNRVGLNDDYSSETAIPQDSAMDSSDVDDANVNGIKFQAHDFHPRLDDASNNNFYKHYHLGKLLHKTEWCRIHVCRSYLTKRECVVKIVRETVPHCHEFEVLKEADHPNLPTMYELFQGKLFEFFIVMKYCEGGSLVNFLEAKRSKLNPLEGIHAGVQEATQRAKAVIGEKDATTRRAENLLMTEVGMQSKEQKRDNQWDLALGKRGNACQSPVRHEEARRGNTPTRGQRRSPTTRGGRRDHSPIDREAAGTVDAERRGRVRHPHKQPVNSKSPLTEEDAKMVMLQLLSCVRYCHDNGIVHCDIKAGNILLNYPKDFSSITLIDFDTSFRKEYPDQKITYQRALGVGRDAAYLAPEVIQESPCYDTKSDIWSCGVTLYKMLSNTLPFVSSKFDDEETIRHNILSTPRVTFPEGDFVGVSEEAKDYITFLLHPRPFERPCARQAVSHQWLASARDRMVEVLEDEGSGARSILHNIRKFNAVDTKMKEAVCAFIASHLLTKEEVQPIDKVFQALDTQHDGMIRRYELKQAIYRVYHKLITDSELNKMMKNLDLDGDGTLSYSEFVMAAVSTKDLLSHSRLQKAFDLFDTQKKGYITHDELREAFRFVQMDMSYLNKIIRKVDMDGDGKITFAEFVVMMTNSDLQK